MVQGLDMEQAGHFPNNSEYILLIEYFFIKLINLISIMYI